MLLAGIARGMADYHSALCRVLSSLSARILRIGFYRIYINMRSSFKLSMITDISRSCEIEIFVTLSVKKTKFLQFLLSVIIKRILQLLK